MTNTQIIINEAVANGLYTKEEVENILASGHMIPLHTFQTWKNAGYSVKKGEHARITTRLWKFTNKAKKSDEAKITPKATYEPRGHFLLFFFCIVRKYVYNCRGCLLFIFNICSKVFVCFPLLFCFR